MRPTAKGGTTLLVGPGDTASAIDTRIHELAYNLTRSRASCFARAFDVANRGHPHAKPASQRGGADSIMRGHDAGDEE
ncbi:hypothetical protein GCM10010228_58380 [Streptomyces massasporeus]|nr:hypothetical protein GCM10010228_58380 [Streptomyces massasporeus]